METLRKKLRDQIKPLEYNGETYQISPLSASAQAQLAAMIRQMGGYHATTTVDRPDDVMKIHVYVVSKCWVELTPDFYKAPFDSDEGRLLLSHKEPELIFALANRALEISNLPTADEPPATPVTENSTDGNSVG